MKYLMSGLACLAFIGGVIWLIRYEAERTRETIKAAAEQSVDRAVEHGVDRTFDRVTKMPGKVLDDFSGSGSGSVKDSTTSGKSKDPDKSKDPGKMAAAAPRGE